MSDKEQASPVPEAAVVAAALAAHILVELASCAELFSRARRYSMTLQRAET